MGASGSARALVTGGAGFIGSHVVENLLSRGWHVTVLDDFSTGKPENLEKVAGNKNLEILTGDILDTDFAVKAVKDAEVVFHLAAVVSQLMSVEKPLMVNRVNVEGTLKVLEESRKARVERFVYASSIGVYGDARESPIKEDAPMSPRSPYAASKAAGEHYCLGFYRTYGLKVTCLRYANVYGPRSTSGPYSGVMASFADRLLNDQPPIVFGDGEQTRDFVYSTDVADATIRAGENANAMGMAINIGTGIATSVNQLARIMAEIAGKRDLGVVRAESRPGEIRYSQADASLAKKILGYECSTTLPDGIRNFLTWYARRAR